MWVAHSSRVRFRPATRTGGADPVARVEIPDLGCAGPPSGCARRRPPATGRRARDVDLVERSSGTVIGRPMRRRWRRRRGRRVVAAVGGESDPSAVPAALKTWPRLPPKARIGSSVSRSYCVSSPPRELTKSWSVTVMNTPRRSGRGIAPTCSPVKAVVDVRSPRVGAGGDAVAGAADGPGHDARRPGSRSVSAGCSGRTWSSQCRPRPGTGG